MPDILLPNRSHELTSSMCSLPYTLPSLSNQVRQDRVVNE
jgi:hypothetical protein